jgi:hypothetical protein
VLAAIVLFAVAGPVAALFDIPEVAWAFRILAVVPLLRCFAHLDMARMQRDMRFGASVWVDIGPQVLVTAIAAPLALWLGDYRVMLFIVMLQVATMTMVFTFPPDFEARALSYRRRADFYQKLVSLAAVVVKAIKIFTAFGLIISLAVLIVAGICLVVAAIIAMARGGGGQRGKHHQILTQKLRFLLLQLRQVLWLYAICGGGSQDDPFMREVAGDLAFVLTIYATDPIESQSIGPYPPPAMLHRRT